MTVQVCRLDAAREADFYALHGELGQCWCVAWHVPTWDGWGERSADENRALRAALFARGEHDGYLGYEAGRVVAWCQVGPRDRLVKLRTSMKLEEEEGVVAVSCFYVAEAARGRGVARAMLRGVLSELRERGVKVVEAYPKLGGGERMDADEAWNGPRGLFEGEGFVVVREAEEPGNRCVMRREM